MATDHAVHAVPRKRKRACAQHAMPCAPWCTTRLCRACCSLRLIDAHCVGCDHAPTSPPLPFLCTPVVPGVGAASSALIPRANPPAVKRFVRQQVRWRHVIVITRSCVMRWSPEARGLGTHTAVPCDASTHPCAPMPLHATLLYPHAAATLPPPVALVLTWPVLRYGPCACGRHHLPSRAAWQVVLGDVRTDGLLTPNLENPSVSVQHLGYTTPSPLVNHAHPHALTCNPAPHPTPPAPTLPPPHPTPTHPNPQPPTHICNLPAPHCRCPTRCSTMPR